MNEEIKRYEDRYGSPDFEEGKGSNLQKVVDRKQNNQMKKYGIKPSDTMIDTIKKVVREESDKMEPDAKTKKIRDLLKSKGMSDEAIEKIMQTSQDFLTQETIDNLDNPNNEQDDKHNPDANADAEDNKVKEVEDEKRIKFMQLINPRVVKSAEMKGFMTRTNVKEEILAKLNELATHKLDLYKVALALEQEIKLQESVATAEKVYNRAKKVAATHKDPIKRFAASGLAKKAMLRTINPTGVNTGIASGGGNRTYRIMTGKVPPFRMDLAKRQASVIDEQIDQLDEGNKENKNKLRSFTRKVGNRGAVRGLVPFDQNHSPLRSGRGILRNTPSEEQQRFNLVRRPALTPEQEAEKETARLQRRLERGQINPDEAMAAAAEGLRQQHYALHEDLEQLDELKKSTLDSYVGKAKESADDLAKKGKYKRSTDRRLNIIRAQTKQIAKRVAAIKNAISEETEDLEQIDEANRNIMRQGRTNIVKARVRKGKIQRRKRVSAVKGYTIRGGKLKRMSMQERIRRKRGQKRGKIKRRAKMARALMRRKRSMRKRAMIGL